jgi:F0F1-type ATP synthase membrane subunit c/vacuolar-type H+-ATPase subunit K
MLGQLRKLLFGISLAETTAARRGFTVSDDRVRDHLEKIGRIFVQGYHAALIDPHPTALATRLAEIEIEFQGFAYEGAAMGLTLLDILTPWGRHHLRDFLDGPGAPHAYMLQVGVGWALARLRRPVEGWLERLDPAVKWLALDGYGFHEGYFHWPRYIEKQMLPPRLSGYACRGFDQGLGRCLWFVKGADVARIAAAIAAFPAFRQADLWSGVGLACAYAGGVERPAIAALAVAAGVYQPQLAQGVVFAAGTRQKAGNPAPHTDLACRVVCGISLVEAAHLFALAGQNLPTDGPEPAFEVWRQRLQAQFICQEELTP